MSGRKPCNKLTTIQLREATLEIAKRAGYFLERRTGPQLVYCHEGGLTVRVRTSNDRCLMSRSSSADMTEARLCIEGADMLLLGVPTTRRGNDKVEAYLVPTEIAVRDVKTAHKAWLDAGGASHGTNKTPAIWLDECLPTSDRFSQKWAGYRIGTLEVVANGN